mgnify:CR=1 FL=1
MSNIDAVGGDSFSLQWSQKSAADFPHRVKQNLPTGGQKNVSNYWKKSLTFKRIGGILLTVKR